MRLQCKWRPPSWSWSTNKKINWLDTVQSPEQAYRHKKRKTNYWMVWILRKLGVKVENEVMNDFRKGKARHRRYGSDRSNQDVN